MGNLIVSSLSIFIPLTVKKIIMPYVYYPSLDKQWTPPNGFIYNITSMFFSTIILIGLATISGIMVTLKYCNKYEPHTSFSNTYWIIIGYFIGNFILLLFPILKAPLLICIIWVPYADYISHGLFVYIFVLIFGAIGNSKLIKKVCNK